MPELAESIQYLRLGVCALMRSRITQKTEFKKHQKETVEQVQLAFVGTAWCIVRDRLLLTAHHTLNNRAPRNPNDKFHIFTVPNNDEVAYHFSVSQFHLEDATSDLAIFEIPANDNPPGHIESLRVSFAALPDGARVATYGFPAPLIGGANVDPKGNYLGGGQFFLKAHANEGIIAAQYFLAHQKFYEFNVGWHHGESGGPVMSLDSRCVFAVMQQYRNIIGPQGTLFQGPHQGRSLECIKDVLVSLGADLS
jgi:hypothetical protein